MTTDDHSAADAGPAADSGSGPNKRAITLLRSWLKESPDSAGDAELRGFMAAIDEDRPSNRMLYSDVKSPGRHKKVRS
jgi:hypothetical protein